MANGSEIGNSMGRQQMRVGVSCFAWTAKFDSTFFGILPALREHGLTAFEVPLFDSAQIAGPAIRRAIEASELECTVCAILPPGINPISPDATVRSKSLEHLRRCIRASAELGAKLLCGPLLAPIGYLPNWRRTAQEWSWAVEAFVSLTDLLDSYQVTLSVEPVNRSETFFLRTAAEAVELCEAVNHPRMGVTIDTFHANIEEKSIADAVRVAGRRLKHIHASENDRGLLGSGHVDFPGIIAALKEIGYDGYLIIEGFGYLPQATDAPGRLLADVNVSPEQIAFGGADYLRSLL